MKKIAVASGKGGTGKTTFSLLLSKILSEEYKLHLIDCDVEEPNCHLFLKYNSEKKQDVTVFYPDIDVEKCNYCGKCQEVCEFNALLIMKNNVLKFNELCHGCKGCLLVCPVTAIREGKRKVGELFSGKVNGNFFFSFARMNVGEARAVPLISELKRNLKEEVDFVIFDSPPGAACPVVEVVKESDFTVLVTEPTPFGLYDLKIACSVVKKLNIPFGIVINQVLVTEPTPFGLYDLKIACSVVKKLNIPFGIVINQSDGKDVLIEKFALEDGIKIIQRLPFSIDFAKKYSEGEIDINFFQNLKASFLGFVKKLNPPSPPFTKGGNL